MRNTVNYKALCEQLLAIIILLRSLLFEMSTIIWIPPLGDPKGIHLLDGK